MFQSHFRVRGLVVTSTIGARSVECALAVLLLLLPLAASAADLTDAQNLLLKGRYEEAREQFTSERETNPAAAIGLMRCHEETGQREQAAAAIAAAVARFPKEARIHAEQARRKGRPRDNSMMPPSPLASFKRSSTDSTAS
jgi:thioredoxin-like negative regulator of GroEL